MPFGMESTPRSFEKRSSFGSLHSLQTKMWRKIEMLSEDPYYPMRCYQVFAEGIRGTFASARHLGSIDCL